MPGVVRSEDTAAFRQASHHSWALPRKPSVAGLSAPLLRDAQSSEAKSKQTDPSLCQPARGSSGPSFYCSFPPTTPPPALSSAHSSRPSEARPGCSLCLGQATVSNQTIPTTLLWTGDPVSETDYPACLYWSPRPPQACRV